MISPRAVAKRWIFQRVHDRNQSRRAALKQERGLAPEVWGAEVNSAGHLAIGGLDCVELVRQFGSPLYVVDAERLRRDYADFIGAFAATYPRVELGFSYKTNPVPGVIEILHRCGALAEVISHFELWLALQLGMPGSQIIFNGPAKTKDAIDLAVRSRVKIINLDGFSEIGLVADAASREGIRQRVGVRVVTSVGWQAQFGLRIRSGEVVEAFRRIKEHRSLHPAGLHVHLGTGIKDVPTYVRAIQEMLELSRELKRDLGVTIDYLDLGGGFGVPSVQPFDIWDTRLTMNGFPGRPVELRSTPRPSDYAAAIVPLVRSFYSSPSDYPTIAFEPGRALSSSAQSLMLEVLAVKRDPHGFVRVILNGGKNFALPMGYEYHELLPASGMRKPITGQVDFFGPLCHPGDVLFVRKPWPAAEQGDVVAIMDAGAYFVPNQMNFSNPRPAVVVIDQGSARLSRARERFEDIVRLDGIAASGDGRG